MRALSSAVLALALLAAGSPADAADPVAGALREVRARRAEAKSATA